MDTKFVQAFTTQPWKVLWWVDHHLHRLPKSYWLHRRLCELRGDLRVRPQGLVVAQVEEGLAEVGLQAAPVLEDHGRILLHLTEQPLHSQVPGGWRFAG